MILDQQLSKILNFIRAQTGTDSMLPGNNQKANNIILFGGPKLILF